MGIGFQLTELAHTLRPELDGGCEAETGDPVTVGVSFKPSRKGRTNHQGSANMSADAAEALSSNCADDLWRAQVGQQ